MTSSQSVRQFLTSQFDRVVRNTNITSKLLFVSPTDSYEKTLQTINSCAMFWDASQLKDNTNSLSSSDSTKRQDDSSQSTFPIYSAYAMAFGTIPIAYCAGAVPEVITHKQSGFIWKEITEALGYILCLTQNDQLRYDFSILAQTRIKFYSSELFLKRLKKVLVLK